MPTIQDLTAEEREAALTRTLKAFELFCLQNFGIELYPYQLRIAEACLRSVIVEPGTVAIQVSRQAGKTEIITLVVRFLIIFQLHLTGQPLMCGLASPKGEIAKTSCDRIKKSLNQLQRSWQVEDREHNAVTIRAYRFDTLHAEVFRFSLAPTTSNESKTLNLLVVDEAHKADDQKRSDQLDPMLASTNGSLWMIGVGNVRVCDFHRATKGELPNTIVVKATVDDVIADRRRKYEETGDPSHLNYEKAFERELRKKGRGKP